MKKNTHNNTQPTAHRAFCLVDIENLAQGSRHVPSLSKYLCSLVDTMLTTFEFHMTVVASGPSSLEQNPNIYWDWNGSRILKGQGVDGADEELINVLEGEPAASASSHILLWSGDGIFADSLERLRSNGCHVSVFGPRGAISNRLYSAAHRVAELPLYLLKPEVSASTVVQKVVSSDFVVAA